VVGGDADGVGAVVGVEFGDGGGDAVADGAFGQVQVLRDLVDAGAGGGGGGGGAQHFAFGRGQWGWAGAAGGGCQSGVDDVAFILADSLDHNGTADPIELTYTICPQLSPDTIERVDENLRRLRGRFSVPIILENSPQYFSVPGSTMSMPQFVAQVAQSCDVDLLLDVTHFLITTSNMELDPMESLHTLPLERVVEIHFSGMSMQSGRWWDDHSAPAPDTAFDLLEIAKSRIRAKAVTFEYNWASSMPETVVIEQITRARELLAR